MSEIEEFEAAWEATSVSLGLWRHDYADACWLAFANAADEAANHANGLTLFHGGTAVPALFRDDLTVIALGASSALSGASPIS